MASLSPLSTVPHQAWVRSGIQVDHSVGNIPTDDAAYAYMCYAVMTANPEARDVIACTLISGFPERGPGRIV
jgi:TPR repeat protein